MRTFQAFLEAVQRPLYQQLLALRPLMVQAAQKIYDEWDQEASEFGDWQVGMGGICDEISSAISGVVVENIRDAEVTEGEQPGDDHSWTIVYNQQEAYNVDIPCHIYERGGGMSWEKLKDVQFGPNDVSIWEIPRNWIEPEE